MLNVSHQTLRIVLSVPGVCSGNCTTTFTDGTYSVSPSVDCGPDETWDSFIERIMAGVDYQLALW